MKLYGGIDLHSNNCVMVLLDEEDRVVYWRRPSDERITVWLGQRSSNRGWLRTNESDWPLSHPLIR
jgi:hypothetical protein